MLLKVELGHPASLAVKVTLPLSNYRPTRAAGAHGWRAILTVVLFTAVVMSASVDGFARPAAPLPFAAAEPALAASRAEQPSNIASRLVTARRPSVAAAPETVVLNLNSRLTFYDCMDQGFCGAMANGEDVYEGAAACSYDLSFGTRFIIHGDPTKRIYVCKDRGLLSDTHVDIFWYRPEDGWLWQTVVGSTGAIAVLASCEHGSWSESEACGYVGVAQ
jgi:hypothetical protein